MGAQFCRHQSAGLQPYAAIIAGRLRFLPVAFPAISFVARLKSRLRCCWAYGLTMFSWAVRLLFARDKVWYARRTGVVGITGAGLFYHGIGGVVVLAKAVTTQAAGVIAPGDYRVLLRSIDCASLNDSI